MISLYAFFEGIMYNWSIRQALRYKGRYYVNSDQRAILLTVILFASHVIILMELLNVYDLFHNYFASEVPPFLRRKWPSMVFSFSIGIVWLVVRLLLFPKKFKEIRERVNGHADKKLKKEIFFGWVIFIVSLVILFLLIWVKWNNPPHLDICNGKEVKE